MNSLRLATGILFVAALAACGDGKQESPQTQNQMPTSTSNWKPKARPNPHYSNDWNTPEDESPTPSPSHNTSAYGRCVMRIQSVDVCMDLNYSGTNASSAAAAMRTGCEAQSKGGTTTTFNATMRCDRSSAFAFCRVKSDNGLTADLIFTAPIGEIDARTACASLKGTFTYI